MTSAASDRQVEVSRVIRADRSLLYDLVTDVTAMGRWSPETTSCRWLGGATGPSVGARFVGANRDRWRRWATVCTVVTATPGEHFSFEVGLGPLPVAKWTYEFAEHPDGCRVTETWDDRRPQWMVRVSPIVMGVADRAQHNRKGMEATLAALTSYAEREPGSGG